SCEDGIAPKHEQRPLTGLLHFTQPNDAAVALHGGVLADDGDGLAGDRYPDLGSHRVHGSAGVVKFTAPARLAALLDNLALIGGQGRCARIGLRLHRHGHGGNEEAARRRCNCPFRLLPAAMRSCCHRLSTTSAVPATGSPIVALYHCSLRPAFIERFDGWRVGPATLTSINMCRMSLAIRRRGLSAMGKARPDLAAPNPQVLAARRGVPARLAADQAEQWDGADKFPTGVDQRSHRPHGGGARSAGSTRRPEHQSMGRHPPPAQAKLRPNRTRCAMTPNLTARRRCPAEAAASMRSRLL